MKILVTGAAGFIGYHLCKKLLENPENYILGLDNFFTGKRDRSFSELENHPNFRLITDDPAVNGYSMVGDVEQIYHLAGAIGTKDNHLDPYVTLTTNIKLMENLVAKFRGQNVKIVFTSTNEIYGGLSLVDDKRAYRENAPVGFDEPNNPRWTYAFSKAVCEAILASSGIRYNIARLANVYGERMINNYVVKAFIERSLLEESPFEVSSSNDTRPLTYVGDTVDGLITLMNSTVENEIWNIGNSTSIRIGELAPKVYQAVNKESNHYVFKDGDKKPEVRHCYPDKAQKVLGWTANVNIDQGINKTVAWYKNV